MVNSKDVFKTIESNFIEFKTEGSVWCDTGDVAAASRARSYSKKIMKDMRLFVALSIKEAVNFKAERPVIEPTVEPTVEPVEVEKDEE